MKRDMSSVQLRFMVRELQPLVGARIDDLFHSLRDGMVLLLYRTGTGKVSLHTGPKLLYALPGAHRSRSSPFAQKARKHLKNAILRAIEQVGSERLVALRFSQKSSEFTLFVELFGKGNLVLCDAQGAVLAASSYPKGTTRDVVVGKPYVAPPAFDAFALYVEELSSVLARSSQDSLVKALAKDLGIGGTYAEEICLRAGQDKRKKPAEIPSSDVAKIHQALQEILGQKLEPVLVEKDGSAIDAQPISLYLHKNVERRPCQTFSQALSQLDKVVAKPASASARRSQKLRERLSLQEEQLVSLEKSVDENTAIGNAVYENYAQVSELLDVAARYRKTKDEKLLAKLKKHEFFESLDEKSGSLVLSL